MFTTPILFLVYNRPELTKRVFEQIRKIQPAYFYIAADGPRTDKLGEDEICAEVKNIILSNIDWDCEVKTLFRDENLGCGKAVSQAITWFFKNVEEGIILEDDCLPDQSFFKFCEILLSRYKDDEEIIAINGCNFNYTYEGEESYFFSRYMNAWGWATWKRSAKMIDYSMLSWNKKPKLFFLWKRLRNKLLDLDLDWYRYWRNNFDAVAGNTIDTWDYQWQYHQLLLGKKTIVASNNLIINLGFGFEATHTSLNSHPAAKLQKTSILFPLIHPQIKKIVKEYEEVTIKPIWHIYSRKKNSFYLLNYLNTRPFIQFLKSKLKIVKG